MVVRRRVRGADRCVRGAWHRVQVVGDRMDHVHDPRHHAWPAVRHHDAHQPCDKVGYAKLEGRQGAAISVLGNINKAGFNFPQEPVWVDPKTKDAIWRGTGYNGIYLLGEGDYNRVKRAMDRQEQNIKGVTAGSDIPVYRIYVGQGKNQTSLKNLRKTVLKCKSYQPTSHKNKLMAAIHSKSRFMLTKTELNILNERLRTLQMKNGMGIPKGVDPMHPQRISRRAMRGR